MLFIKGDKRKTANTSVSIASKNNLILFQCSTTRGWSTLYTAKHNRIVFD